MFLLWYWFSWVTCYDRYSFYRGGFVTCFSLPHNRKSPFGFGIWYFVLTLCGCGMAIFVHFNLLLGILIYLSIISILVLDVKINTINAYKINNYLEHWFNKCLTSKLFSVLIRYFSKYFYLILYIYRRSSDLITIIALYSFISLLSLYIELPILLMVIIYDFYLYNKYNTSLLLTLKNSKDCFCILLCLYFMFKSVDLYSLEQCFYLMIIFFSVLTLLYINIIDKNFKKKVSLFILFNN